MIVGAYRLFNSANTIKHCCKCLLVTVCCFFSNSNVLTPIPMHLIPIPIPWLILLPFPWESHGIHGISVFLIPMHTSSSRSSMTLPDRRPTNRPTRRSFVRPQKLYWSCTNSKLCSLNTQLSSDPGSSGFEIFVVTFLHQYKRKA